MGVGAAKRRQWSGAGTAVAVPAAAPRVGEIFYSIQRIKRVIIKARRWVVAAGCRFCCRKKAENGLGEAVSTISRT